MSFKLNKVNYGQWILSIIGMAMRFIGVSLMDIKLNYIIPRIYVHRDICTCMGVFMLIFPSRGCCFETAIDRWKIVAIMNVSEDRSLLEFFRSTWGQQPQLKKMIPLLLEACISTVKLHDWQSHELINYFIEQIKLQIHSLHNFIFINLRVILLMSRHFQSLKQYNCRRFESSTLQKCNAETGVWGESSL